MRNLLPLVLLLGCDPGKRASDTFTVEDLGQGDLDVLWVLDNSVSMNNEQVWLDGTEALFFEGFDGADTHIGVTTTDRGEDDPLDWVDASCAFDPTCLSAFAALLDVGTDGSDFEEGLGAGISGLTAPSADASLGDFLRPGGRHLVIVLSDENDCTAADLGEHATGEDCYVHSSRLTPVDTLLTELLEVDPTGRVQVSGIVGPDIGEGCDLCLPGSRYWEAIERTGGARASVCDDVEDGFATVTATAVGTPRHFRLSTDADPDHITVTVGEEQVPEDETDGWTYDAPLRTIELHGDAIPVAGQTVHVEYSPV